MDGLIAASKLEVRELIADGPAAYADLWRFVLDIDLVAMVEAWNRPADEPLVWLMTEPRRLRMRLSDGLWVRLVDVPAAMQTRGYASPGRLVLEVDDRFCPWNAGRVELVVHDDGTATCVATDESPDLRCSVNDLGSVFLGGARFADLRAAGQVVEVTGGVVDLADRMFGTWPAPWSSFVL